jgi:choice-of-anchor C domain-containing protein
METEQNMKKIILLAMVCLGVSAQAIVVNGSFETGPNPGSFSTKGNGNTDITGWTVISSVDYIGTYWQHSDGVRSLDLSGGSAGGIKQDLVTSIGQWYLVSFDMAGNPAGPPDLKDMRVSVNNTAGTFSDYQFDTTSTSLAAMGWVTKQFRFQADAVSTTLTFLNTSQNTAFGPAVDNVSAEAVPEPISMVLLAAGGALALRRRKSA